MFVDYKVTWTPRINGDWDSANSEVVTGVFDVLTNMSLGKTRDTFSFKLTGFNDVVSKFNATDKMVISRAIDSTVHDESTIIFNGLIRVESDTVDNAKDEVRIEGKSFSEVLLNSITFIDATNLTIDQALKQAIEFVPLYSPGFNVVWKDSNPTTRLDGTSFPVVGERWYNKRLGELFERYSSKIYTRDSVNYYFFVNEDNELVWMPQEDDSNGEFNSDTDVFVSLKDGKDVNDVVNFVIVKGGFDPAGQQIQFRYQDFSSSARHGLKFKVIPSISKNAQVLIKQDMDSLGITTGTLPSIALGSSYSFFTTWSSVVTGAPVEVNNDNAYVAAVRSHTLEVLRREAFEYVEARKNGKLKLSVSFKPGVKAWVPGSIITAVNPRLFGGAKNLRVQSVQRGAEVDVFELAEDEGTL